MGLHSKLLLYSITDSAVLQGWWLLVAIRMSWLVAMSPCSKECTDPDVGFNLMEGVKDPETEKYAEFVSNTLLSLKSKVTNIIVETSNG